MELSGTYLEHTYNAGQLSLMNYKQISNEGEAFRGGELQWARRLKRKTKYLSLKLSTHCSTSVTTYLLSAIGRPNTFQQCSSPSRHRTARCRRSSMGRGGLFGQAAYIASYFLLRSSEIVDKPANSFINWIMMEKSSSIPFAMAAVHICCAAAVAGMDTDKS